MNFMFAGLGQKRIDHGIIESSLLGFQLFPINGDFDRIDVQEIHRGPNFGQNGGPSAGIVHLRAQDQIRRAVDDEGVSTVLLDDVRNGRLVGPGGGIQQRDNCGEDGNPPNRKTCDHIDSNFIPGIQ